MENINKWLAYNELAWTEPIIAPPEEYAEETEQYIKVIKEHSKIEVKTLLHIGCGAGGKVQSTSNRKPHLFTIYRFSGASALLVPLSRRMPHSGQKLFSPSFFIRWFSLYQMKPSLS